MHASTSDVSDRASPQTCDERPRPTMALTLWRSVSEDAGKPASMTCTPIFESCSAIASFSSSVNEMPGVCSPSRSVVSKTVTFFFAWLSVKKAVRFSVSRCFSVCRFHTYSLSAKVYKVFGQPAGGPPGGGGRLAYSQEKTFSVRCRRQGRGTFRPPPRQPLPRGRFPHGYTATGVHPLTRFQSRTSPKILSLSPCARPSCQSPHTARPLSRGREEAAERPGGGGGL